MAKLIREKNAPGKCAKGMVPLSIPEINGHEWKYLKECLDTGWVSSAGSYVDRFESAVAHYTGRKYAIACASGTAALHTALMIAGLEKNEEVLMPTLTFAAPAFAVRYTGAWPVFMDVDPLYWQIDVSKMRDFLARECVYIRGRLVNRRTKRTIRAILPVHLLGHPVDMDPLLKLARQYGLSVIEDVAESMGAQYKGRKAGSFGDVACFSFNGNKVITCGGGGMITTNDRKMALRARHLTTQAKREPVECLHDEVGYNYRLTNIQAAVGVAQMEKLHKHLDSKRKIAQTYRQGLSGITGIVLPQQAPWAKSIWWLYTIQINKQIYGKGSRELMRGLARRGIQARPLWHPLHSQDVFKKSYAYRIENAGNIYERSLSIPSSAGLCRQDQDKVIASIKQQA